MHDSLIPAVIQVLLFWLWMYFLRGKLW